AHRGRAGTRGPLLGAHHVLPGPRGSRGRGAQGAARLPSPGSRHAARPRLSRRRDRAGQRRGPQALRVDPREPLPRAQLLPGHDLGDAPGSRPRDLRRHPVVRDTQEDLQRAFPQHPGPLSRLPRDVHRRRRRGHARRAARLPRRRLRRHDDARPRAGDRGRREGPTGLRLHVRLHQGPHPGARRRDVVRSAAGLLALLLAGPTLAALAENAPPARIRGIAHVAFRAGDLASSRRFYEGFLGLRAASRTPPGPALVVTINGRQTIELPPGLGPAEDRLDHLAFQVDDLDGARRAFSARSIAFSARGDAIEIRDPESHVLKLVALSPGAGDGGAPGAISAGLLQAGVLAGPLEEARFFYQTL